MSGFNNNYFNRHLINDMRNALNSVFNEAATPPAPETPPIGQQVPRRNAEAQTKTRHLPRSGQIDNNPVPSPVNNRPLSINPTDGSFNISQAARDQAQSNRDAISNARAETGSGLSRMARGADGRPVSSYVNPNSPEGRVEASIAAGKEPDLPRAPGGRIITNDRGVQNPDAVGYAAGQRAFDASIASNTRDVRRQDTRRVEGEVSAADIAKHGPMPNDAPGSNTPAMRVAKEIARGRIGRFARKLTDPAAQTTDAPAPTAPTAARSSTQINTSEIPSRFQDTFDRLNQLDVPEPPTAQTTGTPAQPTAQTTGTPATAREKVQAGIKDMDQREKMFNIFTGNNRPVNLGRDARADNAAKKRIYKQDREAQATAEKAREDQNEFRKSKFALDETMWNGTIGPNGGQRAKPAGSPKPTLKVENTVKPKTPPQTFFPMR